MSKYIIEIEDEPFVRLSALFGEEGLYRAKGFNSLVFDQFGLDKLTPFDKELEEAYQKGKHDAEQDLARAAYEEAYQKGYEVGQHEATTLEYQQGLDDAWKALLRITGLNNTVRNNIFGMAGIDNILVMYTAQEAIAKICEHEEQQKADAEIKVGDEVRSNNAISDHSGIVLALSPAGNGAKVLENDGSMTWVTTNVLTKTGRHFNFLTSLLEAMKGEQRNCSKCEHDGDPRFCDPCRHNDMWQQKEVTE